MTIDKAERLRLLDAEKEFNMCGISGRLLSIELSNKDYSFLFTEAERAQELELNFKSLQQEWVSTVKENKRFREALEEIEKDNGTPHSYVARKALEVERCD